MGKHGAWAVRMWSHSIYSFILPAYPGYLLPARQHAKHFAGIISFSDHSMLLNYVIIISFLQVTKLRLMKTFVKGHTRYKVVELNSKPGLCGSWTGLELMSVGPA